MPVRYERIRSRRELNPTMNRPRSSNTNLLLLLLTFVTGLALGWLINDFVRPRAMRPAGIAAPQIAAPAATTAPSPTAEPSATPQPTATSAPSPTAEPSATPQPTATTAPSPTVEPSATPQPTSTARPTEPPQSAAPTRAPAPGAQDQIVGYAAHQVAPGETLDEIAVAGGSTAALISDYNHLSGAPQAGRALIVPQQAGRVGKLDNAPLLVERGRTEHPWVALTLDAGASAAPTPRMLKALRDRGITITFFLTGAWIRDNPELARQIVADGHEIANHTVTHPDLRTMSDEQIGQELADTDAIMRATTGVGTQPFFRPPYGAYNKRVLQTVQSAGYLSIYWTLDSLDSVGEPKTPEFLLERVTGKLDAEQLRGAIILAHCGSEPTADALPAILDRFAAMGFEVKKVSEVLEGYS
jgi:peptidoglycan/xylan/chitin deacetylase (PgdA/CDA1 family)